MKQLLKPCHFIQEEKPKKEDFISIEVDSALCEVRFQKALQDWNKKYIKPEPEWISFEDEKPNPGQSIYWNIGCGLNNSYWQHDPLYIKGHKESNKWADKQSYDKQLEEWEYYQQKFFGWNYDHTEDGHVFILPGKAQVDFDCDGGFNFRTKDVNINLSKCPSLEFAEEIFKEFLSLE